MKTKEIIFIVNESLDGGFEAKAVGHSIFTEAENEVDLKKQHGVILKSMNYLL